MLKVAALFPLLATLASAAWKEGYAPKDNSPCYVDGQDGVVKGTLCVVNGLGLGKRLLGGDLLHGLGLGKSDNTAYRWREGDRCDIGGCYGYIKDTLCVVADVNVKRHTQQYGFGWFHPGPYAPRDRCWTGTQEGYVQGSQCVANSGGPTFGVWWDQPYYGYGHPFGWYHPGPFIEGDRCIQDGRHGLVRNALCVDLGLDLNLGDLGLGGLGLAKRWNSPDYWYEPYFGPEYNFGWFHEGPFSEGDRCWSKGRYGNIANSLCVLAEVNLKRDLLGLGGHDYRNGDRCFKHNTWGLWTGNDCDTTLDLDVILNGRSLFEDGDKCWHEGSWGAWKGNSCDLTAEIVAAVQIAKRELFRDDPWLGRGVPCTKDGRRGILRDSICIVANIDLNIKRDEQATEDENTSDETATEDAPENASEDQPADATGEAPAEDAEEQSEGAPTDGSTSGWEYDGDYDNYIAQQNEGPDGSEADKQFERRLLSFAPGDNGADHAVAKTVNKLLGDIRTRGLLKGADAGKPSPFGNGAPPAGLAGDLGLDKILQKRELLGSEGFRIEDIVKTFGLEKRKTAMRSRQVGGLGGNDLLGGLLGGKSRSSPVAGDAQARPVPASPAQGPTSGKLLGGLLGDKGHGKGNLLGGLV